MGFFNFFGQGNINQGVEEYKATPGAVLLDVRTISEYREGHIPGSRNIPLQNIGGAAAFLNGRDTPVFTYCHSGARSGQAAGALRRMGYTQVKNIGGIAAWKGKVEL